MEQIKYKVPFASIGGTLYNINIYAEYSGEPIVIWGSQQPFVTEEDQNEDRLTPIRTQSGYINIVTSRDVWLDIIENASLVTLTSGDEEKWVGFISKQAFNGDAFEQTKAYQIPVHDILTQWQSYKFEASPFNSPTFAKILTEAMDRLPVNAKPLTMCWQDRIANDDREPTFFECRFQRYNMYNGEMPEDGQTAMSDYTYFDVISEICKYFGMTLSVQGRELVFMSSQDSSVIYHTTTQDLHDVEGDGVIALRGIETIALPLVNLNDLKYVSIDNQESVLPPVKEVKIVGSINPYKDFDGTYPKETIDTWVDEHMTGWSWRDITQGGKDYRRYERDFDKELHPGPTIGGYHQEWDQYDNENVSLKLYGYENNGESLSHFSRIRSLDDTESEDVASKIDFEWKNMIFFSAQNRDDIPVLGIYGKRSIYLSANSGAINFFYRLAEPLTYWQNKLRWRLSIGDKYWNGGHWSDQPETFVLGWRSEEQSIQECDTNRYLGDGYDGCKGQIIPIPTNLQGKIVLELIGSTQGGFLDHYFEDIALQYVRPHNKKNDEGKKEVEVVEQTEVDSIADYSQSCMFATSRDVNGYGTVLAYSGVALSAYNYGGTWQIPEVFRNGLVRWNNNRPLSVLDIEVSSDGPLQNRYQHIGEAEWSAYIILSMSRDWRDDKLKLKLLEFI